MTQANTTIEHLGAEYFSDPYSVHARLRAEHPATRVIMPCTCSTATRLITSGCANCSACR